MHSKCFEKKRHKPDEYESGADSTNCERDLLIPASQTETVLDTYIDQKELIAPLKQPTHDQQQNYF